MRIVLDTNTVVSAAFWHGAPRRVMDAVEAGSLTAFTSPALLHELTDVVSRGKFAARLQSIGRSPAQVVEGFASLATIVTPATVPAAVVADPDDDAVIACAVAANAESIVSGDRHLLGLQVYQGIQIITAAELLTRLP